MYFHEITQDLPEPPEFKYFWLNDRNKLSGHSKKRRIASPNKAMRLIHRRLLIYLRALRLPMPNAVGGTPGSSPLKSLDRHRMRTNDSRSGSFNRNFYLLDLSNAYGQVDKDKLVGILERLIMVEGDDIDLMLYRYCMSNDGGLIVGAPASPDLFNIYCEHVLDCYLRSICEQYGLSYTRYLDDITFSSTEPIGKRKRLVIRQAILAAGFKINHKKAQVLDLKKGPVTINGVGVRWSGDRFLPRHALYELRGLLHRALTGLLVNPAVIHGKMGMFRHLTDCYHPNATEARILDMYYEFRMMFRKKMGPTA